MVHQAEMCLHELFEAQVHRSPQAPAVEDVRTRLTYEELDRKADLLASYLRDAGVRPGELVGVYMERRAEYVVACLAALKAGGAYLILELAYPPSLLLDVVADAGPRVILTQERYAENLPEETARLCMDEGWEEEIGVSGSEGSASVDQENLAFVSYSSGTTGKPKGIANPHRAAVRAYLWRFGLSDYGPGDRVGCNVFFIWEMLRPLLRGATTVVIPDDVIYDPVALIRFLEEYGISETLITPSLLETVLDASGPDLADRLSSLRVLWLNGEVVTRTLARRALSLLPETRLLNVYSCSETHEVAAGDLRELVESPHSTYCPVGRPMDSDRLYILDEEMREVSDGEAGELFVGGECLARGYVNLPEKTEESFPADPFSSEDGARMYRTGDKARVLPDGNLEILGRTDFMVKIRGYSVELGAVEAAVEDNLAVRACVVVADGEEGTDKRLVAYLVPASEDERGERYAGWNLDPRTGRSPEIRHHLQDSLPHYAIPATFMEVEALPLHEVSGKVDRRRLPEPPARVTRTSEPDEPVRRLSADAPRSEKESLLARAWEDVLRLDRGEVRRDDNFFDLGGHSLAAAQLSSRVEDAFGVHVTMGAFLEDPTVGGLCDRIEALQRNGDERPSRPDLRAEAVLDPEIVPERGAAPASLRGARGVFLTGATGYLGAFLLDALLRRTDAEIHCLVRPREDSDPRTTIRYNLRRYGLSRSEDAIRRVVPVAGDLGKPLFGMTEEAVDELAREVDVVIHAGAVVNLVYPYGALAPVNVGGTREVLRLACMHEVKPVHHVSTNGIFPAGHGLCEEDVDLDVLADAREDGYGQSKWVAEKLVQEAAGRGLPVRVYRPGNISGHSVTGTSNPRDFLGALIAESLRIGAAPEIKGWRMEMTPVDFVAETICHLAGEPDAPGRVFHLANPDPPPASEVFSWLEDLGYRVEHLPYPEWLEAQREASQQDDDVVVGVLGGTSTGEQDVWDANVYDDRNTRRALEGSGLERPAIDGALLERYA
ncbi:MAG TPA: amino acid adenylation domain-containing protein, partial [Rubrobacteraceae bacterium]|nr:amino acid adenylation domain-containing protein [Rubrobacteraceae bacterium]